MNHLATRAAQRADLNAHSTDILVEAPGREILRPHHQPDTYRLPATNATHAPFPDELSMATRAAIAQHAHQSALFASARRLVMRARAATMSSS
jgi:hypothetical protein